MKISHISCKNFRNFKSLNLDLSDSKLINVISASNGMGKSNLLEMMYYLSHIRPFRNVKDRDLMLRGESNFFLSTEYMRNSISGKIAISYDKKKEIFLNQKKVTKFSSILGEFLTVLFSNEDIYIINGSPSIRRRFFDIFFSILDKEYLYRLSNYQVILKKKNHALKDTQYHKMLPVYDQQLTTLIVLIQKKRKRYIELVSKLFQEKFITLGMFEYKSKIIYSPELKCNSEEEVFAALEKTRKSDIENGYSGQGPHRDKYLFLLNGLSFAKFASLGQTRLASLILKAVQSELYRMHFDTKPVLLLDDVILELDPVRKQAFLGDISNDNQMFITVTDDSSLDFFDKNRYNIIRIDHGQLK